MPSTSRDELPIDRPYAGMDYIILDALLNDVLMNVIIIVGDYL
jgi:hypothetical protein